VLRKTKNLKLVQQLLDHQDLKSTLRYVSVLDAEVVDARSELSLNRKSTETPVKLVTSEKKSA